jgi:hypothetical protein
MKSKFPGGSGEASSGDEHTRTLFMDVSILTNKMKNGYGGLLPQLVLDHWSSWNHVGTLLSLWQDRRRLECPRLQFPWGRGFVSLL